MFSILSRRCPLLATSLSVIFCLLSMLISDSRFDLVWFRLSCDHGWIRSGSVNARKQQQQQQHDLLLVNNGVLYRFWIMKILIHNLSTYLRTTLFLDGFGCGMYYSSVFVCSSLFFLCPCMAINVSVQYNDGFLPDIILLTQCYYHRGTRLNAMKRFCIFSY